MVSTCVSEDRQRPLAIAAGAVAALHEQERTLAADPARSNLVGAPQSNFLARLLPPPPPKAQPLSPRVISTRVARAVRLQPLCILARSASGARQSELARWALPSRAQGSERSLRFPCLYPKPPSLRRSLRAAHSHTSKRRCQHRVVKSLDGDDKVLLVVRVQYRARFLSLRESNEVSSFDLVVLIARSLACKQQHKKIKASGVCCC